LLAGELPGRVAALYFHAGGEGRAVVPVWEVRVPFVGLSAELPPLTPYWGAVLPAADLKAARLIERDRRILSEVAAVLRRRYPYMRLLCHPALKDIRPFSWAGFRVTSRYTSLLRPAAESDAWAAFPSAVRNKLRQGDARLVRRSSDARPFAALYETAVSRLGVGPAVRPAFWERLAAALPGQSSFLYYDGDDGEPVAGRVLAWDDKTAYDLAAAATPEGLGPRGALLFWEEIKEAWARGLPLDVVGVNVPSIARFKDSFGGEPTPYYLLSSYRSLFIRGVAAWRRWRRP